MTQVRFVLPLALAALALALFAAGDRHSSAITPLGCQITVNSPGDGMADDAFVTLREAISYATDAAEPNVGESGQIDFGCDPGAAMHDVVLFDAGVFPVLTPATITLGSALPPLNTGGDTVDGAGAGVTVDGAGAAFDCFTINSSVNVIEGLVVEDCLAAITVDGTAGDAVFNWIGGVAEGQGNVLSSNGAGLQIEGGGAGANAVWGNYIGTDVTGTAAAPNGIGVRIDGASFNSIGAEVLAMTGATQVASVGAGERGNVISGNTNSGVVITGAAAHGNIVQGNYIGTDVSGLVDLGNGGDGVLIFNAFDNTIGPVSFGPLGFGDGPGEGNLISGNQLAGVEISGDTASGNVVRGNMIGTDAGGAAALGNSVDGVRIAGAPGNTVGGSGHGDGNVISGNVSDGVAILSPASTSNVVAGNLIGTDFTGYVAVPNGDAGVGIESADDNTVGGTAAGALNIISGNLGQGVAVIGGSAGNFVQGNWIGTAADGLTGLGNGWQGVLTVGTGPNTIGGTGPGAGNRIAFNGSAGVGIGADPFPLTGKAVLGNFIHDNFGLGIDLEDDGVDLNDAGDPDTGANARQNYPVLASATVGASTTVEGTLNSTANTGFRIEFFASDACDPSGYGEGKWYLGYDVVTTDGDGNVPINKTLTETAEPGSWVTATATDPDGNTSEFSKCVGVTGGATPTPTATPSPTPEPTPTPTPTPEPTPSPTATPPLIQGDADCDQDVDAVDALWVLRKSASIEPFSACIAQGDIQCDADIDSVDALGILRHVAALPPLAQNDPCAPIGDSL